MAPADGLGPNYIILTRGSGKPGRRPGEGRGRAARRSEHGVVVRRLLGHVLADVPMLDHLAVLQPEDVDDGGAARARFGNIVDVQDHVVAVGETALDVAVVVRKFLLEKADERLEAGGPIGGARIMLDIARAEMLGRRLEILLVDAVLVELDHHLLVGVFLRRVARKRGRGADQRHRRRQDDLPYGPNSLGCLILIFTYARAARAPGSARRSGSPAGS